VKALILTLLLFCPIIRDQEPAVPVLYGIPLPTTAEPHVARLRLEVPEGSRVWIDGRDFGAKADGVRVFVNRGAASNVEYPRQVTVTLGTWRMTRQVFLQGGWTTRIEMRPAP
jgi:hypothetical protein